MLHVLFLEFSLAWVLQKLSAFCFIEGLFSSPRSALKSISVSELVASWLLIGIYVLFQDRRFIFGQFVLT